MSRDLVVRIANLFTRLKVLRYGPDSSGFNLVKNLPSPERVSEDLVERNHSDDSEGLG